MLQVLRDLGIGLFADKVDLVAALNPIADGYLEDNDTSIADVVFPVNSVFNQIRDGHIAWYGGNSLFNPNSVIFAPILDLNRYAR